MERGFLRIALRISAVLLSVIPPIWATLSYFPIWRGRGTIAMLSGFTVILLLISIVPLLRLIRRFFKSPTATTMWFILFLIFFALSKIADEMVVISLFGYLGNLSASFLWRISGGIRHEG